MTLVKVMLGSHASLVHQRDTCSAPQLEYIDGRMLVYSTAAKIGMYRLDCSYRLQKDILHQDFSRSANNGKMS